MPAFEYIAINRNGKEERGILEGDTARAVRQMLREKQLSPLEVSETSQQRKKSDKQFFSGKKISANDLALFTRQLATLTRSGSPLEEALATVAKQSEKNHVKSVILSIRSRIVEGHSLASALREMPKVFPDLYASTVDAGEQSGHLDTVLERLADYTETRHEMNQKITMAMAYPMFLTAFALIIVVGLLTFVVPKVVGVFENMNQELPMLTQVLIISSDFLKAYGLILAAVIIIAVIFFFQSLKNKGNQTRFHLFVLQIPVVGKLVRGLNTARFARTLSILASSNVPILEALRISSQVIPNLPMRKAVEDASARVREGTAIARALGDSGLFPPMTVHLIASGESSGKLEEMLERAAQYQENETNTTITTVLNLFEYILILIMGVVVLLIVLAILQPILQMDQIVK